LELNLLSPIKQSILENIEAITKLKERGITVRELYLDKYLQLEVDSISINALDRNLRNYYGQGLLKRFGKGHKYYPYRYKLSKKGLRKIEYFNTLPLPIGGEELRKRERDEERKWWTFLIRRCDELAQEYPIYSIWYREQKLELLQAIKSSGRAQRKTIDNFKRFFYATRNKTDLEEILNRLRLSPPVRKTELERTLERCFDEELSML
jgi:hypothetical protein